MKVDNKITLTIEGLNAINQEIKKIEGEIAAVDAEVTRVLEVTDLHDSQYHILIEEKEDLLERLTHLRHTVQHADLIDETSVPTDKVGIGSVVKLVNHKICHNFRIVSSEEASPLQGKISDQSPIALQIMGRSQGEEVTIDLPNGKIPFVISEITRE